MVANPHDVWTRCLPPVSQSTANCAVGARPALERTEDGTKKPPLNTPFAKSASLKHPGPAPFQIASQQNGLAEPRLTTLPMISNLHSKPCLRRYKPPAAQDWPEHSGTRTHQTSSDVIVGMASRTTIREVKMHRVAESIGTGSSHVVLPPDAGHHRPDYRRYHHGSAGRHVGRKSSPAPTKFTIERLNRESSD